MYFMFFDILPILVRLLEALTRCYASLHGMRRSVPCGDDYYLWLLNSIVYYINNISSFALLTSNKQSNHYNCVEVIEGSLQSPPPIMLRSVTILNHKAEKFCICTGRSFFFWKPLQHPTCIIPRGLGIMSLTWFPRKKF